MRLEFFNAADGDSYLLTSNEQHLLVDGGRKGSFMDNVLPSLDAIRRRGEKIDAVCVSHIDADHITGILALFDLTLDWRVYDYHHDSIGHDQFPEPSPRWRPPTVDKVWHNGFSEQINDDPGAPTSLLQSTALILAASTSAPIQRAAEAAGMLATSIAQGNQLAHHLGTDQLQIPVNPEVDGNLMTTGSQQPVQIGDATLALLGPTDAQIDDLRQQWTAWVSDNQDKINQLNRESQRNADRLGLETADAFFAFRDERARTLADRANVTIPNLASIMFFVQERDSTAILTGDGFGADVITALETNDQLGTNGLHVDVLKVPHHGSEHNSDESFYEKVTADHYVIPSDGSHHNPDLRVIEDIIKSRVGRRATRTLTPQANDPFTIYITANPDASNSEDAQHLRKVRSLIKRWQRRYPDNVKFEFLAASSFVLDLD